MSKVFEINNFKQVVSQMNDLNQTLCLKEIKASLQRLGTFGYFEHQNSKSLGCGKKLIWKELPPLSGPLLKELLQTELIDYFNDSDQLLKDEGYDMQKELEKTYKDLMNQVIKQQHSHIKVVPQQQTKMLKQTNQQNNQQDSIVQNYKQLIGKTKQDQSNVKKRYSVVLMIDQNQLTDIENMETCNSERFTFKK